MYIYILYYIYRNGVYPGYNPLILTFDPDFLGKTQVLSGSKTQVLISRVELGKARNGLNL